MNRKFVLGDTWQEVTEGDQVGDVVPDGSMSEGDQVDVQPVFMVRVVALTTTPVRVDSGLVAKYADIFVDVSGTDTYRGIVQAGQSVDESSGIIVPARQSIKIPMQRGRSVSLKMASGSGTAYIVFNSEPFKVW